MYIKLLSRYSHFNVDLSNENVEENNIEHYKRTLKIDFY